MPTRARLRPAAAILALALAGTGCTGDDAGNGESAGDGSPTTSSTTTRPEPSFEIDPGLTERVEAAGFAFAGGDYPPQPDGVPWPTERWPTGDLPEGVDPAEVTAAVQEVFAADTEGDTIDAVLVVSGGEMVLEEYNGWDPGEYHPSWSMAKSITSALVGILAGRGEIDVFAPAGAPEWSDPDDPRHGITVDELLRMSSGLEWTEDYSDPDGDVLSILGGEASADRAAYAASKPLREDPDTRFYYSTGTANIVAREVAAEVGFGEEYSAWITENLFEPLGIEGADVQLDDAGVINGGSWVAMRPVDFARFGYLFLRGGRWEDTQVLPTGWVDYSRLPTPTDDEPVYGAHWWIDPDDPGRFYASGFNGQSISVVPEDDLVVVVLSNSPSGRDDPLVERLVELFAGS